MKNIEYKIICNIFFIITLFYAWNLNNYNWFYGTFFFILAVFLIQKTILLIISWYTNYKKIVSINILISNLLLCIILWYFIILLWNKFWSTSITYSSLWIGVLAIFFISEYKKLVNNKPEKKDLDIIKFARGIWVIVLITIITKFWYIDNTNFKESKDYFTLFKEKITFNDYLAKNSLFEEQKAKTLLENIDFEWIFDDHKETQNSFLTANTLSTSEVVRFKKIYLKTKWDLKLSKNQNYNYTNYISLGKLYLVLGNYYLLNAQSEQAKEVYLDLIKKNSQILNQNTMMSLLVYNWITQRILDDIELNKNIFKIKDLREVVKALDSFKAKERLKIAFNEEYIFNYNQLKDFPSVPLFFDINSYLKKLEYKYYYQINNNWEDYFKDYKPSLLKSNFFLNFIFTSHNNNEDRIKKAFEIEENIKKLKQTY